MDPQRCLSMYVGGKKYILMFWAMDRIMEYIMSECSYSLYVQYKRNRPLQLEEPRKCEFQWPLSTTTVVDWQHCISIEASQITIDCILYPSMAVPVHHGFGEVSINTAIVDRSRLCKLFIDGQYFTVDQRCCPSKAIAEHNRYTTVFINGHRHPQQNIRECFHNTW